MISDDFMAGAMSIYAWQELMHYIWHGGPISLAIGLFALFYATLLIRKEIVI
jgi:hypothetical protein